ncbi:MAG: hypothetical protein KAU41_12495 [Deltaproteobacteria bacterium]|jgi:hypothetical protein|nr:hypothetical protein [Deltaproteobacteria bacterium]
MDADSELVGYFHKHLVPIFFSCQKAEHKQDFIFTAFVLSVRDQWFLITAGHCIKAVEQLVHEHGYQIVQCSLIDTMSLEAKHRHPVPFDYIGSNPTSLSQSREFDYGIIEVSDHYKRLLEANNVQPLNEEVWKKQPSNVDFYMLLGVPAELTKKDLNTVQITSTLLGVEVLDQRPEEFPESNVPLFYGRINLNESLSNIEGMSGGPIFGFYKNDKGELKYWLLALQSRWLPSSRYIMACPTKLLGEFLEEMVHKIVTNTRGTA